MVRGGRRKRPVKRIEAILNQRAQFLIPQFARRSGTVPNDRIEAAPLRLAPVKYLVGCALENAFMNQDASVKRLQKSHLRIGSAPRRCIAYDKPLVGTDP